jgi:hypothetical protein
MRLGRKPHDPAALSRAPSRTFGAIQPPATLLRPQVNFTPGLYRNDVWPTCTAAGLANGARTVAALNGYDLVIEDDDVSAFYAQCVGCADTPDAIAATDGAVMLDVLTRQTLSGFNAGPQLLVGAYATTALDRPTLALAMAQMGFGYLGVDLTEADMSDDVWSADYAPGALVGGHCIVAVGYTGLGDGDLVRVATWGAWRLATWAWLANRLREAHVLAWRSIAHADGSEWAAASYDELRAECLRFAVT